MSQQIRMSPEQMRIRSNEVKNQHGAFVEVIEKMRGIIGNLETEWEGAASRAFSAQFYGLQPSFESMKQLLEDLSTQLDQTAYVIETTDAQIASKFGG